ncbi:hypothetical protein J4710_10885 [Staphylococcus xylosus]|uniref:Uncharacterized protein n=1 Tax=Staphylococcus xylosus TaxID=1288 RepID=A0A939NCE0_STAXY|nr:hypothetical protein [Staphylococcus xylosus]
MTKTWWRKSQTCGGKFDNKNRRSGKGGFNNKKKMIDLLQTETTIRNHQ